jgi:hypothetical protein
MFDHQTYIFKPGEKRVLEGNVADHALRFINTGLKVYDGLNEPVGKSTGVAYDKMAWKDLVSMASKRGLFKPPMTREQIQKLLEEADAE